MRRQVDEAVYIIQGVARIGDGQSVTIDFYCKGQIRTRDEERVQTPVHGKSFSYYNKKKKTTLLERYGVAFLLRYRSQPLFHVQRARRGVKKGGAADCFTSEGWSRRTHSVSKREGAKGSSS